MFRSLLKAVVWLLGIVALALALLFGINATDEPLSAETLAAMQVPPQPTLSENNGFLDFLALTAPAGASTVEVATGQLDLYRKGVAQEDPRWLRQASLSEKLPMCRPGESSCLDVAAAHPGLRKLIDEHRTFLERYRAMRAKPEFTDLVPVSSPEHGLPVYWHVTAGQRLSLLGAAIRFNAGDRAGAIRELELEYAFHRKLAAGSNTLIVKMIAFAALDRDGLFVVELARKLPPGDRVSWQRLAALTRPPTPEELDVVRSLKLERAQVVGWMRTRHYVRMSDELYEAFKAFAPRTRPWWDSAAPYLYRPHQSVNRYVAQTNIALGVAGRPSAEFLDAVEDARTRLRTLEPGLLLRLVLSPAAYSHYLLEDGGDYSDYIGRAHSHAGVQSLVRLQVTLRAAGLTKPADVAAAMGGPLGARHAEPFTGKPMRYDAAGGTLSFPAEQKYLSGVARAIHRNGRVELPL